MIVAVTRALWPEVREAVLEIEALCFPQPWPEGMFLDDLDDPACGLDVVRPVRERPVLGFCSTRQLYDELHIMQIAVHPQVQGRGHGAALLAHAILAAEQRRCQSLILEVRRTNLPAVHLYARQGFRQVGVRRSYYRDNQEDALVMRRDLRPP